MNNKTPTPIENDVLIGVNEINIEVLKRLDDLNEMCIEDNMLAVKIKRINDYIITTYPELQNELEQRFPKSYKINGFKNHIDILSNILINIMQNNIEQNYYLNLTEKKANIAISFIDTIKMYLKKIIDINDIKNNLFLISHEINPENFKNLKISGLLALCEMSENGIDVNQYENSGNLKLVFLNEVANGEFKTKPDEAIKKEQIISSIENCFNGTFIEELEFDKNFSLIFQLNEVDGVFVYTNDDLTKTIAELDKDGNFVKGSLNTILVNVYKNVKSYDEEEYSSANSIDKLISQYNSMPAESNPNQPDLTSALIMALGLNNPKNENNDPN